MIRVKLYQSIIRLAFYKHDSSTHNILRKHNVLQCLIQKIGTRNIVFVYARITRELTNQEARKTDDLLAFSFTRNAIQNASSSN